MGKTIEKVSPSPALVEYSSYVPGFRLVRGRNVSFSNPRTVVHADYSIKLTTAGRGAPIRYRGSEHGPCRRGGITLFEPFEPVYARKSEWRTSFVSLLVDPAILDGAAVDLGLRRMPACPLEIPDCGGIVYELAELCRELESAPVTNDLEERAVSALELLLHPASARDWQFTAATAPIDRARQLILDRLAENVSMGELERETGVSRFHLVRSFRAHYRVPPHEFRIQARVALARKLLSSGRPQAEVAQAVGFFDQSHLHRHFRRIVGTSPGAFQQRSVRFAHR